MIDALFADKDSSSLKAHEAESLLMRSLHVAPQALLVWKVLLALAVVHEASKRAQLHSFNLRLPVRVEDRFISAVLIALMADAPVELFPR